MSSTARRLHALADIPGPRAALTLGLGVLALGFGVALPTTAGYLISRAAEHPPILALTTTIVVVRFLALARPLTRYLERLSSHDVALRALGPLRARVFERIEPLAPAELDAYRRGDLLRRLVGDVDALQGLYLRGLGPAVAGLAVAVGLRRRDGVPPARGGGRAGARARGRRHRGPVPRSAHHPARRPASGGCPRRAHRGARRAPGRRAGARRLRPRG